MDEISDHCFFWGTTLVQSDSLSLHPTGVFQELFSDPSEVSRSAQLITTHSTTTQYTSRWCCTDCCLACPLSGDDVLSRRIKIRNEQGLHARPATHIVKIVSRLEAMVTITYKKKTIDARSVLGILLLAAPRGATVVVQALGKDAEAVLQEIEAAFATSFCDVVF